jgi:hypothetical protein
MADSQKVISLSGAPVCSRMAGRIVSGGGPETLRFAPAHTLVPKG